MTVVVLNHHVIRPNGVILVGEGLMQKYFISIKVVEPSCKWIGAVFDFRGKEALIQDLINLFIEDFIKTQSKLGPEAQMINYFH